MGKKKVVEEEPRDRFENSEDIPIVTKDRDLTPEEVSELIEPSKMQHEEEAPHEKPPSKKGLLKCKCACGRTANVSDEVLEDG